MQQSIVKFIVRQSNKFYDWLLHPVGCFIWASETCRVLFQK